MQCPSCHYSRLQATRLDQGLPALGCADCGGALLPLLSYRDWVERLTPDGHSAESSSLTCQVEHDSRRALSCPKCNGLMTRAC
ncbi:zf-TFIIB domain-containing protein [Marinicella meishanensis]|uniref:zf-TFIIB domain-containing protein n=1 Tax=Marinicella meishanensis TaxID=2873263 RepID=UPI001CBC47CB|nr:zf-TFIIB domain-containing protein [Marinicella sp. NBU2979]